VLYLKIIYTGGATYHPWKLSLSRLRSVAAHTPPAATWKARCPRCGLILARADRFSRSLAGTDVHGGHRIYYRQYGTADGDLSCRTTFKHNHRRWGVSHVDTGVGGDVRDRCILRGARPCRIHPVHADSSVSGEADTRSAIGPAKCSAGQTTCNHAL
jgi:hypothetical protein